MKSIGYGHALTFIKKYRANFSGAYLALRKVKKPRTDVYVQALSMYKKGTDDFRWWITNENFIPEHAKEVESLKGRVLTASGEELEKLKTWLKSNESLYQFLPEREFFLTALEETDLGKRKHLLNEDLDRFYKALGHNEP